MVVFTAIELLLGGVVGDVVGGKFTSLSLRFALQGMLHLTSYFLGGIFIGIISPRVRIDEPAAGAFLSVALMLTLALFTPYSFIQFSLTKLVIGGAIAFALALAGARLGEKLTGRI
jgi:hypothetical protein